VKDESSGENSTIADDQTPKSEPNNTSATESDLLAEPKASPMDQTSTSTALTVSNSAQGAAGSSLTPAKPKQKKSKFFQFNLILSKFGHVAWMQNIVLEAASWHKNLIKINVTDHPSRNTGWYCWKISNSIYMCQFRGFDQMLHFRWVL